jgi:urate oxidase
VDETVWDRLKDANNVPHHHTFTKSAPYVRFVELYGTRDKIELKSGIKDLSIIKTTKSGFTNFWRDRFTTLPESKDRMMRTNIFAQWTYGEDSLQKARKWILDNSIPVFDRKDERGSFFVQDYNKIFDTVKTILLNTFAGPAKTGVYSESVQQTLFEMGTLSLEQIPVLDNIFISLPNLHCFTFDMSKFNIANDNEVFQPQEDPHGLIEAFVTRKGANKSGFRLQVPSRL